MHKITITWFVILALFSALTAHADWAYPVDKPKAPTISRTKTLTNPRLSDIQNAVESRTKIVIQGTVDASNGGYIAVASNDVILDFSGANKVYWSGGNAWDGFVSISAKRVQVLGLRVRVNGSGRIRGVQIYTPSADVKIRDCEFDNFADGLVADGSWNRISIEKSSFLNCQDWNGGMEGGYGMYFNDGDNSADNLRIDRVKITLASSSGQHGIRLCNIQNILVDRSNIGANNKRSLWAFGTDNLCIRGSTFNHGSVLFNLMTFENITNRPVEHVRMEDCTINHDTILDPLSVYCGKGSRYLKFRDLDINSETSNVAIAVGWRSSDVSKSIQWYDGSIYFNGDRLTGNSHSRMSDWTSAERAALKIGPMPDPRND